jgi:hypothetical protein
MRKSEQPEIRSSRDEAVREAITQAIEVPQEAIDRLSAIARMVGGDWGMKVEIGNPGEGSLFDESRNRIQLDPLHIADPERMRMSEFVSAHEGGHRAISRGPNAIGLVREKRDELYRKVGFGFGANSLEDPADNNWWSRKYEGLAPTVAEVYDEQFSKDAAVLGTPEIHALAKQLGYTPKFAHFGSEIIRLWHTGEFSKGIPKDVLSALDRVKDASQKYFEDIPSAHPTETEVIDRARSRFQTYVEHVWPEMERLVREDLSDERIRQMIERDLREKEEKGDAGKSEGGEGAPIPMDELSKELQKELREKMKGSTEDAAKAVEDSVEKQAEEDETDAAKLRKAAAELEAKAAKEGEEKKADGIKEAAKKLAEQAVKLEERAAKARDQANEKAEALREGKTPQPVPMDELSEELRKALERIFSKLPAKDRRELEDAARKELEKLEDALSGELRGKLDPTKPESHKEREDRETHEQDERKLKREEIEESRRATEEIKKAIEGEKNDYDRARADVNQLINLFADDIDRLFLPHRHPRWRGNFPIGGRLDLRKVMQAEARPELYDQMWERKTVPHKKDFKFSLLIDLSGSMNGDKINQTFRGAILLAEALSRSGIDTEVLGFHDKLVEFKTFGSQMDDAVRRRMNGMPLETADGNPGGLNHASYNDDGYCLDASSRRLAAQTGKEKFLIVLSDGEPIPSAAHSGDEWELTSIVEKIRKEKQMRLVGVGLGAGTEHVRKYYPNSVVVESVRDLPRDLAALFEDILKNPETY